MAKIIIYNAKQEDHSANINNFPIYRGTPLGNPFTYNGKKSKLAELSFKTREEAIEAYRYYFKQMYGTDSTFTKAFDSIYEKYRNGEDVYLQCFCKPLPCHGDVIAEMLQKKLIHEYKQNLKASV